MKNLRQPPHESRVIRHNFAAAIVSGKALVFAGGVGFAQDTYIAGEDGALVIGGVVEVDKISAETWVAGEKIYYVTATDDFSNVAAGNTLAGFTLAAAAATVVKAKIYVFELPGA